VLLLDVDFVKSDISSNRALYPLVAASRAIPIPVAPPPIIIISYASVAIDASLNIVLLSITVVFKLRKIFYAIIKQNESKSNKK